MPMGILGVLAMPFGFDAVFWRLMGAGIDWMITVVLWVASLPGSIGHMAAFGTGPLLLVTLGLLLMGLLRTPLRWSGALLAVVASLWALHVQQPDVLVSGDGQSAAVRTPDGRLTLLHSGRDTFAVKEWLAASGESRTPKDKTLKEGVRCDPVGCTARLADGRLISYALSAEAFAEDCARAAVVVSPRQSPIDAAGACKAQLIDRSVWRVQGATALTWGGDRFEQTAARPEGYERPWARRRHSAPATVTQPTRRPVAPDATPRVEDLTEGD
jgi:competence protein ComEC